MSRKNKRQEHIQYHGKRKCANMVVMVSQHKGLLFRRSVYCGKLKKKIERKSTEMYNVTVKECKKKRVNMEI